MPQVDRRNSQLDSRWPDHWADRKGARWRKAVPATTMSAITLELLDNTITGLPSLRQAGR
jgi:hypothetical protein